MAQRGLTPKQARFVEEYLIDLSATGAARRAGYSERMAQHIGYQLLQKSPVQEAIAALKAARSQRTQIDADWLLRRLAAQADADLADLYDEQGGLKPVREWPDVWRRGLVAGIETFEEFEGQGDERRLVGHTKKLKLFDRIKNLELIGRHVNVGAFREKVELTGKNGGPLEHRHKHDLSDDELAAIASRSGG